MKIIYNYNIKTKIFTGTSNLLPDDFNTYNLPAFSTDIEMVEQEGYIAKFNGTKWDYIKKYKYSYIINNDGFISNNGIEIKTDYECPNKIFYKYESNSWVLDIEKAKQYKIDEIRQCRSECWQKFDGLYLGYERDGNTSMILDCENLRQSLKNAPTNALSAMSDMTTLEQVESVNLCGLLAIPDSLKDYVDSYFNIS